MSFSEMPNLLVFLTKVANCSFKNDSIDAKHLSGVSAPLCMSVQTALFLREDFRAAAAPLQWLTA